MDTPPRSPVYDRRTFLLSASAMMVAACTGSSDDESEAGADRPAAESSPTSSREPSSVSTSSPEPDSAETAGELEPLTPAMFDELAVCATLPSSTSGPFPSRELLDRRVIHDGYPGHPLRLGIRVVDDECRPVPGAVVEIWHTDASGDYSDYADGGSGKDEAEGTTFCRGAQTANGDGILEFETLYPGWYEGRAVHIHTTVHVDGSPALTAQLYFDEDYTDVVHATGEYAQFGPPDTGWADDGLIGDPADDGTGITVAEGMTRSGAGTLGLVNIGI